MKSLLTIKESKDFATAMSEAVKKQSELGGSLSFPVNMFMQGERHFISTVFPISFVVKELDARPSEKGKGVSDVRKAMNRPIDEDHAKNTKEYIKRNFKHKYILPSITLNIQEEVLVFVGSDLPAQIKPGLMVIPYGTRFSITDGQHRQAALRQLKYELSAEEFDELKNDGINVMITVENDIDQIHQDFADCSKTKELPKSLISIYDKRNPANSFVIDLLDNCPLFLDKVDATNSTLSKKSTKLFLVSQVRSAIKELLMGSSAAGDVDLENRALTLFKDSNTEEYKNTSKKYIDFINKITDKILLLRQVSEMKDATHMTKIPDLRERYLILNSAGINMVCRIAHYIFKEPKLEVNIDEYIAKLGAVDWLKTADIWRGNIVQSGAKEGTIKIATSNATIKKAVEILMHEIGLIRGEEAQLF